MLDYAVRLTRSPQEAAAAGVEGLRDEGFDDRAILDICSVTAYYNHVNRLAEGLGVELEPSWGASDLTISRAEFDTLHQGGSEERDQPSPPS